MSIPMILLLGMLGLLALLLALAPTLTRRLRTHVRMGTGGTFELLSECCDQAAEGCRRLLLATVPHEPAGSHAGTPDHTGTDKPAASPSSRPQPVWPGIGMLSRLLYLALALCILVGEYTVNLLRVPAVQYQVQSGRAPALALDATSGLLWLAVAALWGMLLLEALNVVPASAQLFPFLSLRMRRVVAVVALVGFVLTVCTVGLLYLAGQYLIEGVVWPQAALLISLLQGVLLTSIALVAVWALVPGAVALVSLLAALLYLVFTGLKVLFGLAAARGQTFTSTYSTTPGSTWASAHTITGTLDLRAESSKGDALPMGTRTTSIIAFGNAGRRLLPPVLSATERLGATDVLRVAGFCAYDRLSDAVLGPTSQNGVVDLSTTQDDARAALESAGPDGAPEYLLHSFVDQLVQINEPAAAGNGQVVVICDVPYVREIVPMLHLLSKRLPKHRLVMVGVLPEPYREVDRLTDGIRQVRVLRSEEELALCILLDPRSPLVCAEGEDRQVHLSAYGLASLLRAPLDDPGSPTLGELAWQVGRQSPFAALALASACVASGPPVRGYEQLRKLIRRLPVRGIGDPVDLRNQARALTERILQDDGTCTMPLSSNNGATPLHLSYVLPMDVADPRRPLVVDDLRTWLIRRAPAATAVFVSGSGTPDRQLISMTASTRNPSPYFDQVTCVVPITVNHLAPAEVVDEAPTEPN